PAPSAVYTLSLHDALPISGGDALEVRPGQDPLRLELEARGDLDGELRLPAAPGTGALGAVELIDPVLVIAQHHARVVLALAEERSEEHTSELQSRENLVCR